MNVARTPVYTPIALVGLALVLVPAPAAAVCISTSNSTIIGSLCVGIDCPCTVSFGFDTLRLQENNLRIKFQDTSSSASFPSNDWQLTANDSSNGGLNHFSIDDITGAKTPFRVEAGAPTNSLYVESTGDIGLNTSNPVVELHIVDGDSPTLRLEQDGSSGFTPQTWDVAGNEANFFIRDVTGGSKLPFKIKPGAPNDSVFIAADGDVGLGTGSPTDPADLHIRDGDAGNTGLLLVEDTNGDAVQVRMKTDSTNRRFLAQDGSGNNEAQIVFQDNGGFQFLGPTGGDIRLAIDTSGNLTVQGMCSEGASGTCADYVFEPGYPLMSLGELGDFVASNKHLPNVPSSDEIRENGVSVQRFQGRLLEKIEELTLYTLAQQQDIAELRALVAELRSEN